MDFPVGTLILWGVTSLIVQPLAQYWAQRRLAQPAYVYLGSAGNLDEAAKAKVDSLNRECFVMTHVLVLGALGFMAGLALASPLIGIAWQRKYWPGIIALIAASFVGSVLVRL
jgi:hypothetical protein